MTTSDPSDGSAPRRPDGEEPRRFEVAGEGVSLAAYEWEGSGPPLLFVHATGFHARLWDEVIRSLPGRRAIALDLRGHGRAEKPPIDDGGEAYSWAHFGEDVAAVVRKLDLRGVVGVGHSMGGHSVTMAAGLETERFAGLALVDPVIAREIRAPDGEQGGPSFVAKRRDSWASPDEMFDRFRGREPHSRWQPEVLRDYCEYGLLPDDHGDGFHLACPPRTEAIIYAMGSHDLHDAIGRLDIPARVLRARPPDPANPAAAFDGSPTDPSVASWFGHGQDVFLPEHSHFLPMEAPALVARHVAEVAALVR